MKKTIFIVDDNTASSALAEKALESQYSVITLSSVVKMFETLGTVTPDLILLDIDMPDLDGFETIKRLKSSDLYAKIPVVFLTDLAVTKMEARGIELGAVDFIMKPFSEPLLVNRVKNHLQIDELVQERTAQIGEKMNQLMQLQNSIVFTLAELVENRDKNTEGHIARMTVYTKILLDSMLERKLYMDEMRTWDLDLVVSSARLHDLGKIVIPDSILNKPGKLTFDEFAIVKTHPQAGERIIDGMIARTGNVNFLQYAKLFTAYHHEKWDGTGYPYGLKENKIPLHGRIMAIVDVYDALTAERPYKEALASDEALHIIQSGSGISFDPSIVAVLFEIKDKLESAKAGLSG